MEINAHVGKTFNFKLTVNKKFCELKRGNIGIVEKAQETRFGMSPKYSRYSGTASWESCFCVVCDCHCAPI